MLEPDVRCNIELFPMFQEGTVLMYRGAVIVEGDVIQLWLLVVHVHRRRLLAKHLCDGGTCNMEMLVGECARYNPTTLLM